MPYYNPEPRFKKPARRSLRRPQTNLDPRKEGTSSQKWRAHPRPAEGLSKSNVPKTDQSHGFDDTPTKKQLERSVNQFGRLEIRSPDDIPPKLPLWQFFTKTVGIIGSLPVTTARAILYPKTPDPDDQPYMDFNTLQEKWIEWHHWMLSDDPWKDYRRGFRWSPGDLSVQEMQLAARPEQYVSPEIDFPTKAVDNPNFVRPPVPTVNWFDRPETGPYIAKSPKIGTVEYVVPDYDVSPPISVPWPEKHSFLDEIPVQEIPSLLKEFDIEKIPELDPTPEALKQLKPDNIKDVGVSIEITAVPNKNPVIRFRPTIVRGSTRRQRETKAHSKWIKLSQLAISLTFGTYTEVMDFVEILVWDSYYIDPKTGKLVYAMFKEDYKMINVINGIAEGKYHVDIGATLVDYGVSQATDILIGQASRRVTREVIDYGGWQSPQGPQGFINKMQKDYRNVLSQYETEISNEKRRLLSLPPLSQSERKLWNAKSGLSPSVRG